MKMKKLIIIILFTLPFLATAQNTLKVKIADEKTKLPLSGVSIILKGILNRTNYIYGG